MPESVSPCILIRYRFTNELLSTSIETIDLSRLANEVTWARYTDRLLKAYRNERSDHVATRETASYILFSAKTRINKTKQTYTKSGVQLSLRENNTVVVVVVVEGI